MSRLSLSWFSFRLVWFSVSGLLLFLALLLTGEAFFDEPDGLPLQKRGSAVTGPAADPVNHVIVVGLDARSSDWFHTTIFVHGGQFVRLEANPESRVCTASRHCATSEGDRQAGLAKDVAEPEEYFQDSAPPLALLARFGDGPGFVVGQRTEVTVPPGKRELLFAENVPKSERQEARGGHEVRIIVFDAPGQPDPAIDVLFSAEVISSISPAYERQRSYVIICSFAASSVFFLLGLFTPRKKGKANTRENRFRSPIRVAANSQLGENIDMPMNERLPADWNEAAITRSLGQLRDQRPAAIPHFVDSIVERFVLRQDDRTAQVRLQFLQTQLEQLKLAKELVETRNDLELLGLEKAKRIKTLQLETEELDDKRQSRSQLDKLARIKERKKIELEIAQLDQQIAGIKAPAKSGPTLSPAQERARRHTESERRLTKLKEEKQKSLMLGDEHERVLKVNAIDDEIQREMVEWSKTLP